MGIWAQIVQGFLTALLAFLEKRANTPTEITDVNTPKTFRDQWAAYLRGRLRDKSGSGKQ